MPNPQPLDERLIDLVAKFRELLIEETENVAGTRSHDQLTLEHLETAFSNLVHLEDGEEVRTARQVIDEAIRENAFGAYVLYGFAILFVLVGVSVVLWGSLQAEPAVALIGAGLSGLFWPAMTSARRTRKENIAIRLLEAPLARADTAKDAAEMIREQFGEVFGNSRKDG